MVKVGRGNLETVPLFSPPTRSSCTYRKNAEPLTAAPTTSEKEKRVNEKKNPKV